MIFVRKGFIKCLQIISIVQKVVEDDLATYEDKPHAYWEIIPDAIWTTRIEGRSLQTIAEEVIRAIFACYEEVELGKPIYILSAEETPTEVILALTEELEHEYGLLPVVRIYHIDPQTLQVTLGHRKDLPLRLRLVYWDEVVLLLDIWTSREGRAAGDPPDCPRGKRLHVVYRQAEEKPRGYFAASYEEANGGTVGMVLHWSMVMAVADWEAGPPPPDWEGNWTAISSLNIFSPYGWCWYVQVDERIIPSMEQGPWTLPFFQGYLVDARLRQFRSPTWGEIVPFESEQGQILLLEMKANGLSTASVPAVSELGRRYSKEMASYVSAHVESTEHGSERGRHE